VADAFAIPKRAMAIFAHPDDVDFGCSARSPRGSGPAARMSRTA